LALILLKLERWTTQTGSFRAGPELWHSAPKKRWHHYRGLVPAAGRPDRLWGLWRFKCRRRQLESSTSTRSARSGFSSGCARHGAERRDWRDLTGVVSGRWLGGESPLRTLV